MTQAERIRVKERFGEEEIQVIYRRSPDLGAPKDWPLDGAGVFPPLNPRSYVESGIQVDQDMPIELRDGVTIYADIYRPAGPAGLSDLPAILSWSSYGKRANAGPDAEVPGVPRGAVSNMTKFEGPDPKYWCSHGYAIVNTDGRGAGHSEGHLCAWGAQDGMDGYDAVEWVAGQSWCNGRVSMAGNSSLATSQWYVAAEQPPHLACIAPWEGLVDLYRYFYTDNGIPQSGFVEFVSCIWRGTGYIIDNVAMLKEHPLMNAYWESKIPRLENITVPAYVAAGWSHVHLQSTINAFRTISSSNKWLRVHRDFEWPDQYAWWNLEDLKRFFDRYLKDIRNGWESTPPVRLEVMDAYDFDYQVNRPEKEFPLARTQYRKLYLDAAHKALSPDPVETVSRASYDAAEGRTVFDIRFQEETEITGFMKVRLWVQAEGNDEMDLFVTVLKLDEAGEWVPTSVMGHPHPGAWGRLRVSQRELDPQASTDYQPVQSHRRKEKLKPGEIVPVDLAIFPHSRIWHEGEQLRLEIAGRYFREGWFEPFSWETDSRGLHVIHTGGGYESYLQVPIIPPKHKAGDYVYR